MDRRTFVAGLGMLAAAAPARADAKAPLVLAAASLQEALGAAADAWRAGGHARPVLSFAASSALARQVSAGAQADLFLSADDAWMDDLARRGLLAPGTRAPLVANRLVLVQPRSAAAPAAGVPWSRLLAQGRIAMADPAAVPAGRYGRAALLRLGLWSTLAPRIVRAENVRAALALVERGAAPWGIVYATDARAAPRVRVARVFAAESHPPIRYPVARLARSTSPDAEPFRRFLLGSGAKAIFARFGFQPL